MATWESIGSGPIDCEWEDVLRIKEWSYNGNSYRSLKAIEPVNYVTIDLGTGEICDLQPLKPVEKNGQYQLF